MNDNNNTADNEIINDICYCEHKQGYHYIYDYAIFRVFSIKIGEV
jgi:hypothetical protein